MRPNLFLKEPKSELRRPARCVYFENFAPAETEGRVLNGCEIAPSLHWFCANPNAELFYGYYDGAWEFELDRPAGDYLSFVFEIEGERRNYFREDLIFSAGFRGLKPVQFADTIHIDGEFNAEYLGKTFTQTTEQEKREWVQTRFTLKNEAFDYKEADRLWVKLIFWPMETTSFSFEDLAIWLQRRANI